MLKRARAFIKFALEQLINYHAVMCIIYLFINKNMNIMFKLYSKVLRSQKAVYLFIRTLLTIICKTMVFDYSL